MIIIKFLSRNLWLFKSIADVFAYHYKSSSLHPCVFAQPGQKKPSHLWQASSSPGLYPAMQASHVGLNVFLQPWNTIPPRQSISVFFEIRKVLLCFYDNFFKDLFIKFLIPKKLLHLQISRCV